MRDFVKLFFGVVSVMVFSACSLMPEKADGSASLEKRVEERWSLLAQGRLAEAYAFLSPAARDLISFERYAGGIKLGSWRSGTVRQVQCAADDLCTVEVDVKYVYKPPKAALAVERIRGLSETWRKDGGVWWYVPAD